MLFWGNAIPDKALEVRKGKICLVDEFCKMHAELKRIIIYF